jgi:Tol biopolymer transport system component
VRSIGPWIQSAGARRGAAPVAIAASTLVIACLLAGLGAGSAHATFPGAPGKIAFQRFGIGGGIFDMNFDGSGQALRKGSEGFQIVQPSYSPDGRQIAFTWFFEPSTPGSDFEIWLMNSDGSLPRQLTSNSFDDAQPAFSSEGTSVVFASTRPNLTGGVLEDSEIIRVYLATGIQVPLTSNTVADLYPAASVTGQIFFSRRTGPDGLQHLFVMNADGSGQRQLTFGPSYEIQPNVSPDGSRVVFVGSDGPDDEIFVMNADGSGRTQLTHNSVSDRLHPVFAPSGRWIAFARDTNGDNLPDRIFRMNADGAGEVDLTGAAGGLNPDWQALQIGCGRRTATTVGTPGRDRIGGTTLGDVISGLGGRDELRGLGGSDVLCGGKKRDVLIGGKGKKDICIGGKGSDEAKGCERAKGI